MNNFFPRHILFTKLHYHYIAYFSIDNPISGSKKLHESDRHSFLFNWNIYFKQLKEGNIDWGTFKNDDETNSKGIRLKLWIIESLTLYVGPIIVFRLDIYSKVFSNSTWFVMEHWTKHRSEKTDILLPVANLRMILHESVV